MNRQWRNLISCERGHGTSARKNWADGRLDRRTDIAIEIHYSDGQMDEQQTHNTVPTAPIGEGIISNIDISARSELLSIKFRLYQQRHLTLLCNFS